MVMSKKEYERMEFYRENATKYEQSLHQKEQQIADLKTYLDVRSKLNPKNNVENKIIQELLQYVNNYMK